MARGNRCPLRPGKDLWNSMSFSEREAIANEFLRRGYLGKLPKGVTKQDAINDISSSRFNTFNITTQNRILTILGDLGMC